MVRNTVSMPSIWKEYLSRGLMNFELLIVRVWVPCLRLRYLRVRWCGLESLGVRFLALGEGSFDSVQSLVPALLEELVGGPGGFAALLVDVVGGGGRIGVGLAPGGHGLVEAVLGALLGPFGDIRGAVEGGYAVVVG